MVLAPQGQGQGLLDKLLSIKDQGQTDHFTILAYPNPILTHDLDFQPPTS